MSRDRVGFIWIECLVVLVILLFLVGLLIPKVG